MLIISYIHYFTWMIGLPLQSLYQWKGNQIGVLMQTILYSIHTRMNLNIIGKSIGCFNIYLKAYYPKWRFDISNLL